MNQPCACGCGGEVKVGAKYLQGHWLRESNHLLKATAAREGLKNPIIELEFAVPFGLKCVTGTEWRNWLQAARSAPSEGKEERGVLNVFCSDCTPEYKAEMVAEGRCIEVATAPNYCVQGHLVAGTNVGKAKSGFTYCKTCRRERGRASCSSSGANKKSLSRSS